MGDPYIAEAIHIQNTG